jgi:hypothetical protein
MRMASPDQCRDKLHLPENMRKKFSKVLLYSAANLTKAAGMFAEPPESEVFSKHHYRKGVPKCLN